MTNIKKFYISWIKHHIVCIFIMFLAVSFSNYAFLSKLICTSTLASIIFTFKELHNII